MIIGYAHAKLLFASLSTSDMLSCCITASRLMAPRSHQGLATFEGSTCPIANQVPSFIHIESSLVWWWPFHFVRGLKQISERHVMNNTLCGEITGDSGHIFGSSLWRGCLYRSCRLEHILQSFEKIIFLFRSWIFGYFT